MSQACETVKRLATMLRQQRGDSVRETAVVSSGIGPLDELLPRRGYPRGSLVEWIGESGGGAATLAFFGAQAACQDGGALIVVDAARLFHPPAATAFGIDPQRLIVLRPSDPGEEIWALDQALRCQAAAAVFAWVDRLESRHFRRLQLSAEAGENLGILLRPLSACKEPSWAEVRWLAEPAPRSSPANNSDARRLRVALARCRNAPAGRAVELEIEDATSRVRLAPSLAPAATAQRQTGA